MLDTVAPTVCLTAPTPLDDGPLDDGPIALLSLSLRYRRLCSKTEITSVGISPSSASAFATYAAPQTAQPWIDFFDLSSQRGYTKAAGSHAVFGPPGAGGSRVATLRDWTVQLGQGVEYHHGSTVMVRDFATGKTAVELKEATSGPVVWSRDGGALAAGEGRNRLGVWDVRSGARLGRVVGHIDEVTHAAFTPDRSLVTLSRDGTVRLTDSRTARTLSRLEIEGSTNPRALAVSPDGRSVVSLWGTTVHIWLPQTSHLTSYDLRATRRAEGWPLAVSPDGRWMACRTEAGFDVVDVASGRVAWERDEGEDAYASGMVTAAAFSTIGRVLLLGRMNGAVEVWEVEEKTG
ncbi:NADP-dependent alcohol dehydrogenase 6 [Tolypocladium paradoxum]|uniref:NADP-dependent alcohol dehydrogenase 6 n=1 Tax=Tolypocladium paradoxum TaxID=94208 RepID=A0A2S4L536_9HYPO|nr:NADP-dependent alcohol dehydrogenase 6 [Tolypocladium paradoxum]